MSIYDEVEAEAREDYLDWLDNEWDDPRPTAAEIAEWDDDPTECPECGGQLTVEPADHSVGIMTEAVYCENDREDGTPCLWPPMPD